MNNKYPNILRANVPSFGPGEMRLFKLVVSVSKYYDIAKKNYNEDDCNSGIITFLTQYPQDLWFFVSTLEFSQWGTLFIEVSKIDYFGSLDDSSSEGGIPNIGPRMEGKPVSFFGCSEGYVAWTDNYEIDGLDLIGKKLEIKDKKNFIEASDLRWGAVYLLPKSVFRPFDKVVADCNEYFFAKDKSKLLTHLDQTVTDFGWDDIGYS